MPQLDLVFVHLQFWVVVLQFLFIYFWGAYIILPLILRNICLRTSYITKNQIKFNSRELAYSDVKLHNNFLRGFHVSVKRVVRVTFFLETFVTSCVTNSYVVARFQNHLLICTYFFLFNFLKLSKNVLYFF